MKISRIWILITVLIIISLGLSSCSSTPGTKVFTTAELASYDGLNGNKAYVAVNGKVYDVSGADNWTDGTHNGVQAGKDVSSIITSSPHGLSVLDKLKIVGTLEN